MAARTVLTTDTLETFRTTFNSLSQTDIGDPATLTTTATDLVGAINEVSASHYSGFTIVDSSSSTTQSIAGGDTITFTGDSNITAAVSATDTVTFTLNSTITGLTSITSTTFTDGTLTINSGSITGAVNITGSGTANFTTDVQVDSVSVATRPFAIAQAVALG
jgi:hypothetical protein